jgi:undecaprenyl-diphosphatase
MLINRDRPGGNIPVFTEHFFSFPSGHSALIITLFGFLTYCIWRNFRTWKIRVNSFFLFGALITLVGFSRLYLGVHFLSDVLGGYLIGFFWFLLGAALSEWQINRSRRRGGADLIAEVQNELQIKKHYLLLRLVTGLLITAEVFFIGAFIISFKPIFNSVVQTAERQVVVLDISDPLFEKYIPKFPENLTGDYQAPLNFIILAKDDQALIKAFALTGWQTADPVRAGSLFKILANYLRKSDYPTEPVAPLFWHGHPNDFAIERAVPSTPVGTRYQARFWRTDIVTEDGDYVYVGSAVLDDRAGFLILRSPARDLDVARDALFTDLIAGGAVARYEKKQFVDNSRGQYYEKGKYITDGRAYLIYTN